MSAVKQNNKNDSVLIEYDDNSYDIVKIIELNFGKIEKVVLGKKYSIKFGSNWHLAKVIHIGKTFY